MHYSKHSLLPHHRLEAYRVALELLDAVRAAKIRDRKFRDEAHRAAKAACLNIAEGAAKFSAGEKSRAFSIARGEAVEACASVEIAAHDGDALMAQVPVVLELTNRLYAMLTGLIR